MISCWYRVKIHVNWKIITYNFLAAGEGFGHWTTIGPVISSHRQTNGKLLLNVKLHRRNSFLMARPIFYDEYGFDCRFMRDGWNLFSRLALVFCWFILTCGVATTVFIFKHHDRTLDVRKYGSLIPSYSDGPNVSWDTSAIFTTQKWQNIPVGVQIKCLWRYYIMFACRQLLLNSTIQSNNMWIFRPFTTLFGFHVAVIVLINHR